MLLLYVWNNRSIELVPAMICPDTSRYIADIWESMCCPKYNIGGAKLFLEYVLEEEGEEEWDLE